MNGGCLTQALPCWTSSITLKNWFDWSVFSAATLMEIFGPKIKYLCCNQWMHKNIVKESSCILVTNVPQNWCIHKAYIKSAGHDYVNWISLLKIISIDYSLLKEKFLWYYDSNSFIRAASYKNRILKRKKVKIYLVKWIFIKFLLTKNSIIN